MLERLVLKNAVECTSQRLKLIQNGIENVPKIGLEVKMKPGPARPGPVLEILENHSFPSCVCCPAGGLDFEKSCFLYLFNLLRVAKPP